MSSLSTFCELFLAERRFGFQRNMVTVSCIFMFTWQTPKVNGRDACWFSVRTLQQCNSRVVFTHSQRNFDFVELEFPSWLLLVGNITWHAHLFTLDLMGTPNVTQLKLACLFPAYSALCQGHLRVQFLWIWVFFVCFDISIFLSYTSWQATGHYSLSVMSKFVLLLIRL